MVLTAATVGMVAYGLYSVATAVVDFLGAFRTEIWAHTAQGVLGLLLVLAAPFVRVRIPGALPLATGALLGLQALAAHAAAHFPGPTTFAGQIGQAAIAAFLLLLGILGSRRAGRSP